MYFFIWFKYIVKKNYLFSQEINILQLTIEAKDL
jgi:hypothetical protein